MTSVLLRTYKTHFCKFCSKFVAVLHFFSFLAQKTLKIKISTSLQHPNAGQNIQHCYHHRGVGQGSGGGAEKNGRGCQKCLTIYGVNGLVANPKKTSLIILNQKVRKDEVIKIKFGNDYVSHEKSAKLLGVTFDSNQGWKTQIYGSGGVIMSLNRRLFAIRRLRSH